jgi:uncharacterized protein YdeI (BOF family)
MKIGDEVEINMLDGSVVIGKLIDKNQVGIIIEKKEQDIFNIRDRTINIEVFIPSTIIKTIKKRDRTF